MRPVSPCSMGDHQADALGGWIHRAGDHWR
jgi:hypothetical protein